MTSRKSLSKPALYSLKSTITNTLFIPIANMIALLLLIPGLNGFLMNENFKKAIDTLTGKPVDTGTEDILYMLFASEADVQGAFVMICVIVSSILLGIWSFKYFSSKKMVNVYYSLGISRRAMYLTSYLPGLIMQFAAIAVPFIINAFVNIHFIHSSAQLWLATFYMIMNFFALAAVAYSLTCAVYTCVGTIFEGCLFTAISLTVPTVILFSLDNFMRGLLWGSPIGAYVNLPDTYYGSNESLVLGYKWLNPLLFPFDGMNTYSLARYFKPDDGGEKYLALFGNDGPLKWSNPSFLLPLIWILLALGLGALGLILFKHRKAELCGFLGKNKVLNAAGTFTLGFFAFSAVFMFKDKLGTALTFVMASLAFAVVYCICDGLLTRVWRDFLHGMVKLPVHIAVSCAIALIFVTGCFGYSSRIPAIDKIESAYATAVAAPNFPNDDFDIFAGYTADGYGVAYTNRMLGAFTSEEDIKLVTGLHESFVDYKGKTDKNTEPAHVVFHYKLKNGRTLTRCYKLSSEDMLTALLKLEDTDFHKKTIYENLTKNIPEFNPMVHLEKNTDFEMFDYTYGLMQFASPDQRNATLMNLHTEYPFDGSMMEIAPYTLSYSNYWGGPKAPEGAELPFDIMSKAEFLEFKKVLAEDLQEQSIEEKYFGPANGQIGSISFKSIRTYRQVDIMLSEDMEKTVKFLTEHDLMKYFASAEPTPVSAEIVSAKDLRDANGKEGAYYSNNSMYSREFTAYNANPVDYYDDYYKLEKLKITDAAKLAELQKNDKIHAYTCGKGYFVTYIYADKTRFTTYITENDAPDFLKAN